MACISSRITTVIQVTKRAIKGTITDLMSHSQFHCTGRVYLDMHGLIFETSICYWQDQPGSWNREKAERRRPPYLHSLSLSLVNSENRHPRPALQYGWGLGTARHPASAPQGRLVQSSARETFSLNHQRWGGLQRRKRPPRLSLLSFAFVQKVPRKTQTVPAFVYNHQSRLAYIMCLRTKRHGATTSEA